MIIYFVRHGQTDDNRHGVIQGHLDTPLNDYGRNEAQFLARRLASVKFDEAWSSSLSRAKETAQIILQHHPGLELQTDAGLMERYLGSLQGRQRLRGEKLPDDIEASDVFRQRITNWLTGFLDTTLRPRDGNGSASDAEKTVLVTSHGAYLTTLLSILLNRPFSFVIGPQVDIRASCYNTSIMRVSVSARQLDAPDTSNSLGRIVQRKGSKSRWIGEILSWADVDHLDSQWEDVGLTDDVR